MIMNLRKFIKASIVALAGLPLVSAILPCRKPSREEQFAQALRFGSEVAMLPKLTDEEIAEIAHSACCFMSGSEVMAFLNSDEFVKRYRIREREAAKRASLAAAV